MKRSASGLCGVLAIDKPYGITSHDVVNRVRRITGERRVGHAGTLDPAATGLMLVGVGAATRLSEYLTGHDKEYDARIVFGASTDTDDVQGRVLDMERICVPDESLLANPEQVLAEFTGELEQMPPAYSAIKKNGVVAYKAAREGTCIDLEARPVTVHEARFDAFGTTHVELSGPQSEALAYELPYWDVHFHVSKGTYIRALARDIGAYLGCGAFLGALRRTAVAGTDLGCACTIDKLETQAQNAEPFAWCDPTALLGFPIIELDDYQAQHVANGRELECAESASDGFISCVKDDKLLAVYRAHDGHVKPATVIPGGVSGVA